MEKVKWLENYVYVVYCKHKTTSVSHRQIFMRHVFATRMEEKNVHTNRPKI